MKCFGVSLILAAVVGGGIVLTGDRGTLLIGTTLAAMIAACGLGASLLFTRRLR